MSDRVNHEIPPVYDETSRVLILGSFPSVKSREGHFFYHHPAEPLLAASGGAFWRGTARLHRRKARLSPAKSHRRVGRHRLCEITGSSDSSIKNVVPNDLNRILDAADIRQIFCNGATSFNLYKKYCLPATNREAVKLPSTSPANAAFSLERLASLWTPVRDARPAFRFSKKLPAVFSFPGQTLTLRQYFYKVVISMEEKRGNKYDPNDYEVDIQSWLRHGLHGADSVAPRLRRADRVLLQHVSFHGSDG